VTEDNEDDDDGPIDDHSIAEKERFTSAMAILPTWLANEQKLHQQQLASSGNRNRFAAMFECSEKFKRRAFVIELTLWAVAFVLLGNWATY
jgi:hypothetical protein